MEALILSCSTGGGHNSAGKAVAEELERRGHSVTFMDLYELAGEKTAEIIGNAYIKLVQKSPKAFGVVYSLGEAYRRLPVHSPVYLVNKKMAECTREFLDGHHFDIVIMSHVFPAHILTNLKMHNVKLPKTMLIATDYTCIPFMEEADCDYYVIPSVELREEFSSKGIPNENILPFGIPVKKEFTALTTEEARKCLHFDAEKKYILLSGGSIGVGKIEDTVEECVKYLKENRNHELIIVCGNNQKLYESLQNKYSGNPQIQLLRSTNQMAEYMKACDVFISKPGGLSSTEAAASGTPLIHISPIPGCESRNVAFFENHGMSIYVKNPKSELRAGLKQLENEVFVKNMEKAQHEYIDGLALSKLCDFAEYINNRTNPCVQ